MAKTLSRALLALFLVSFLSVSSWASFEELERTQANEQQVEAERMRELQGRRAEASKKNALRAKCDEIYSECVDRSIKALYSCGTSEECSTRNKADKKACLAALELCENEDG